MQIQFCFLIKEKKTRSSKLFLNKMRIDFSVANLSHWIFNDLSIDKPEINFDGSYSLDMCYIVTNIDIYYIYIYMYEGLCDFFPLVCLTRHSLQTVVSGFEYFILRLLIIIHYTFSVHLRATHIVLRALIFYLLNLRYQIVI